MSKKHKKVCRVLNYIQHSLIAVSTITGCVSIYAFDFLVGIPIGITIGLKICVILRKTSENFAARLKQANLASKSDISDLVKNIDFDNKLLGFNKMINSNKIKHLVVENELNELIKKVEAISTKELTKDLLNGCKIFNGARFFSLGTRQNHLINFSYEKYFRFFTNTSKVLLWKSIGLPEELVENITTSDCDFAPILINFN